MFLCLLFNSFPFARDTFYNAFKCTHVFYRNIHILFMLDTMKKCDFIETISNLFLMT